MVRITFGKDVGDAPDDTYTLYLDKGSGQVDAIRYTVTFGRDVGPEADLAETFFDYQDYVTVHGLTAPTRFEGYSYSEAEGGRGREEELGAGGQHFVPPLVRGVPAGAAPECPGGAASGQRIGPNPKAPASFEADALEGGWNSRYCWKTSSTSVPAMWFT